MPKLIHKDPKYQHHRASGQAVVTLDGKDFYLGVYGTKTSRREYDRLVGEWRAAGRRLPKADDEITVTELCDAYLEHAKAYYRNKDGTTSYELERIKCYILPVLHRLHGDRPVSEFTPLSLKGIRRWLISKGLARVTINDRINGCGGSSNGASARRLCPLLCYKRSSRWTD